MDKPGSGPASLGTLIPGAPQAYSFTNRATLSPIRNK